MQKIVNDKIFDSMNVTVQEMPVEEAKKLGAMALFGEKYGKVVRVVDIEGWSTEFCGGTHVKNTAQIGGFKIVSESSVAAGIRRIEAVTGQQPADPCWTCWRPCTMIWPRPLLPEGQQHGRMVPPAPRLC